MEVWVNRLKQWHLQCCDVINAVTRVDGGVGQPVEAVASAVLAEFADREHCTARQALP
jgi:hypothetical protein